MEVTVPGFTGDATGPAFLRSVALLALRTKLASNSCSPHW